MSLGTVVLKDQLSWVAARYGGWNCHGKPLAQKKMAKGTMAKGWQRFARTLAGFLIAKSDAVG